MTAEHAQREPTMEEILASIRRIISEEDQPVVAGGDVLELAPTPPPPPPAPEHRLQPKSEPGVAPKLQSQPAVAEAKPVAPALKPSVLDPDDELIVEDYEAADDDVELDVPPMPQPPARVAAPAPVIAPRPVFRSEPEDGLIGEPAASAAAGSLGKLMGSMLISSGNTLDDMVRALLKPMLKEWLDAHLPAIVEMEVEKEIDRIRRLAR